MAKDVNVYTGYPVCSVCELPLVPSSHPPTIIRKVPYLAFRPCTEHPGAMVMFPAPAGHHTPADRPRPDGSDRSDQSLPDKVK